MSEQESTISGTTGTQKVGGQAVIEGVMMRSSTGAAVSARLPDGGIIATILQKNLLSDRKGFWKKPVFRGIATLIDSLRLGISALEWSAQKQEGKDNSTEEKKKSSMVLSTVFAFLIAILLFTWFPLQASKWFIGSENSFTLHLLAGLLRILIFIMYIAGISLMPEIKRIFVYHGAEHQCINAFEKHGFEMTLDDAEVASPVHRRCGTSFILLLLIITVLIYAIIDSMVFLLTGVNLEPIFRILYHIPFIPFIIGGSYEILKLADKHLDTSRLARIISAPGLALQRMTTRKAGKREVEIALVSLMLSCQKQPGSEVIIEQSGTDSDNTDLPDSREKTDAIQG